MSLIVVEISQYFSSCFLAQYQGAGISPTSDRLQLLQPFVRDSSVALRVDRVPV